MKKLLFFFGMLAALFIINNLIHSILNLSQKNSVIEHAKNELAVQEEENKRLKKELTRVQDPSFIEQEARNKLFLVKSGERVVLIPSPSITPVVSTQDVYKRTKPHWKEWYQFFFTE